MTTPKIEKEVSKIVSKIDGSRPMFCGNNFTDLETIQFLEAIITHCALTIVAIREYKPEAGEDI